VVSLFKLVQIKTPMVYG